MESVQDKSHASSDDNAHDQYHRSVQFVLEAISKRYKVLVLATILGVIGAIISHYFHLVTYEARSIVRVQPDQKVSIPAMLANQQGFNYYPDSREMSRYLRYLESESFMTSVAQSLKFSPEFKSLNLTDPKKVSYFSRDYWDYYFGSHSEALLTDIPLAEQSSKEIAAKVSGLVKVDIDNYELITFTVKSLDANTSTVIANMYADEFAKLNLQKDTEEIVEVEKFISEKLEEVKARLKVSSARMVEIKEHNHMYIAEGNAYDFTGQLKDLDRKMTELSIQEAENDSAMKRHQISADGASTDFSEKDVHAFKVSELLKRAKEIKQQKAALKLLADRAEQKFSALPKAEQEYFRLKRQEQVDYDLYSTLVQKLNQLEIQKYSIQKKVNIESLSKVATPAIRVNFFLMLLFAIFASMFFGAIIAMILEWLDPTVKSPEDIVATRIQNIGIIPRITPHDSIALGSKKFKNLPGEQILSQMLVTRNSPKSIEAMAFKYIRARLQKGMGDNNQSKIILITSPTSGDGKSFTACNLAISFAQLGKKTLILDCDLRHPTVNRYFGIPNRKGVSAVLKMERTLDEVVVQDKGVPNLHILPADWNVADPTELLSDEQMLVLLDHLKLDYDYIIVDAPPIQMVVDGLILSSIASSVLVVGRCRKTLKNLLAKTYLDLVNVNFQKIYGVLNDAEESRLLQFFGNYGAYYGGGYGYGSSAKYYTKSESDIMKFDEKKEVPKELPAATEDETAKYKKVS